MVSPMPWLSRIASAALEAMTPGSVSGNGAGTENLREYLGALFVLALVFSALRFVAWPLCVHGFLLMLRAGGGGVGRTYRILFYATAADLLWLIPILGALAAPAYWFVLQVIGLSEAHDTSGPRTSLALLIPTVFLVLLPVLFGTLILQGWLFNLTFWLQLMRALGP